jgi:hypothetical protein
LGGWLALGAIFSAILAATIYFQFRLAAGLESAGERVTAGEWSARAAGACGVDVLGVRHRWHLLPIACYRRGRARHRRWDGSALIGAAFFLLLGGFATWDGSRGLIERQKTDQGV